MKNNLNRSIIYGIYPTSFYDSNGDGIGDLNGICQKLSYVKDLGVDIIWVNPFFQSPFKDGGYDISDYYAIDKKFGTMEDFEKLVEAIHSNGLKLLIDLVVGHTSDKHKWFLQSKKVKRNKYSDWYVWTDSIFTSAPKAMNGLSKRNGNYLVNYYAFQPALNYGWVDVGGNTDDPYSSQTWKMHYKDERLVPLRNEIKNIIKFWIKKGVDGFRVDLTSSLIKGGVQVDALKWLWNDIIGDTRIIKPDCVFMAEWGRPEYSSECGFDIDYFNHESKGYNEMFRADKGTNILPTFESGHSYFSRDGKGNKNDILDYAEELSSLMKDGTYYSIPSGYHDMVRLAEKKDSDMLKCIFAFLITYKNVPLIYYGDEIGIKHNFRVNKDGGYIRTGARTPMQWNNEINRGFSTAKKLYLPVSKDERISVQSQIIDKNSLYCTVKKLISIKKLYEQFDFDASVELIDKDKYPLAYIREKNGKKIFIAINPSKKEYIFDYHIKEILFSQNAVVGNKVCLKPKSIIIGRI